MRRRIRRLRELRATEWLVLFQLVPAASVVGIAARHARLATLLQFLDQPESAARFVPCPLFHARLSNEELYRLADWASLATWGPRRCLQRSLVVHWLLSRRGRAPVLEVGVALREGELHSHAWVTVAGQPVAETKASLAPFRTILRRGAG